MNFLRFFTALVLAVALTASAWAGDGRQITTLAAPRAVEGNPYIACLVAGARSELSRPDPAASWPRLDSTNAPGYFALRGSADSRDARYVGAQLDAYLWLYAHPASPLRDDSALLERFLRRAHAYVDAINLCGRSGALRGGAGVLDDFALGPALTALREFATLYPNRLSAADRSRWDDAFRQTAAVLDERIESHRAAHPKGYTNIDLTHALHALNLGLYLRDPAWVDRSRAIFHRQRGHVLPDGATRYIWSQNECISYHDVVAHYIARIHEITGDPVALEILRGLEWYGPVSVGRSGEFWTSPSWKHAWNAAARPAGGEPVVAVSRNPYVRAMVVPPAIAAAPGRDWPFARWQLAWWTPDIPAREMPDQFTLLDRNIAGPRAWYGRFTYAATLRDIPTDEPGHSTLLGAQILREDLSRGVILMGIYPRVQLGADRANPNSFAWLTSGLRSHLAMGRTWSAFAADYQLHAWGSSRKGRLVPWRGRQLWLCLPDRLIGVLDILPLSSNTPAAQVEGLIRLGTGGTVHGPRQELVQSGPNRHAFGEFTVILHGSSYAETVVETTPFRRATAPLADLVLRDPHPVNAARRFVVEIRPAWAAGDAGIRVADEAGFATLRVALGSKTFTLHRPAPADPEGLAPVRVEVDSPDRADHAPPWPGFEAMAAGSAKAR
jgi:hypothetical protein